MKQVHFTTQITRTETSTDPRYSEIIVSPSNQYSLVSSLQISLSSREFTLEKSNLKSATLVTQVQYTPLPLIEVNNYVNRDEFDTKYGRALSADLDTGGPQSSDRDNRWPANKAN